MSVSRKKSGGVIVRNEPIETTVDLENGQFVEVF
jgi:hypothetical protein